METETRRHVYIFIKTPAGGIFSERIHYSDIQPVKGDNSYLIIKQDGQAVKCQKDVIYMPHPLFGNGYNQRPIRPDPYILKNGLGATRLKIGDLEPDLKN